MANLYDKASLVLPTSPAYKDGAIQAYKPLTSQGTFDFTRGSNLAATRVDVNGLIEKGRENILLQSNNFSSAFWSAAPYVTSTGGQAGYDGTNNAWEIEVAVSGNYRSITQASNTSGLITNSIYAKAANSNYLGIVDSAGQGSSICIFDLTDGSVSYQLGGDFIETSSESVGNGWYRLKVTHKGLSPNYMLWFIANASNSTGGSVGNSVYIQDAQQESGLVATDYIETGASTAQAGILEDMPRLDYSGGASCPALLLEPQRTNVIASSEYLSDWGSTVVGTGVAPILNANAAISPEGVQNAYEATFNSGAGTTSSDISMINYNIGGQGTGDYVLSFYAKVSNGTDKIIVRHAGGFQYTTINLTDKWQRFFVKENLAVAGTITVDIGLRRGLINEPLNSSVTCQIYGLQLEAGSYPTSYIPTYGSSVTRGADDCKMINNPSVMGQTEGTAYVEMNHIQGTESLGVFMNDGSGSNYSYLVGGYISSGNIPVFVINNSVGQVSIQGTSQLSSGTHKLAIAYKQNDFAMYVDGIQIGTDSSGTLPALNDLYIGKYKDNISRNANKKQLILFDTRLTNAELASLTTL